MQDKLFPKHEKERKIFLNHTKITPPKVWLNQSYHMSKKVTMYIAYRQCRQTHPHIRSSNV